MANENETMMDVCSEWRECIEAADPSVWDDERIAGLVKTTKAQQLAYLDRIEAAWKREREELDKRISDLESYAKLWTDRADELRLKCDEFYAKAKPVGNAAALREALREAIGETCAGCKRDCDDCMNLKSGWMKKAKAALSAPARNCDMYKTAEDAHDAYDEITHADIEKYDACRQNCPICDEKLYIPCEVKWLLAPAAERKGE